MDDRLAGKASLSRPMNGLAGSENDFVKTKVNDDYIKTLPPRKESLPFFQEDAARNNGSENDVTITSRDGDHPDRSKFDI